MQKNCSGPLYKEWEAKRRFIADTIPGDGTILDVGCAGGLFLWSLMEWTGYNLDPYDVDIEPEFIVAAKALFANKTDHFAILAASEIGEISKTDLPRSYDYVYCSVLGPGPNIEIAEQCLNLASKRVIFGFYGRNRPDASETEHNEEREELTRRVRSLEALSLPVAGHASNPTHFNQLVAWIDK
jgi:hypothetical protein